MKMAHAPPGHHSVVGRPSVGGLAYPEYVVYRGEQVKIFIFIYLINSKDLFDWSHNPSHSTLYPDVLKIKTIIVEKQNFTKMPFVYYLQVNKSISDNSAAWTSWQ